MLKKLVPLFLLFVSICSFGQTLIPDPNFEQFLVDQGIDTNGITGDILNADAQAVTDLNITRNDITDFTGLEAFVNVVTLDLGNNQFASAPLTTLMVLEELEFEDNDALSSLDLTQNTALRILDIGSIFSGFVPHPPITELDLSQNINLESLDIFLFINMSSLILPETPTLTEIDIYRLGDSTLDFSKLDGLLDLRVRYSEVSTVITLPDVRTVLEEFEIQGIVIPTIDVSEYTSLVDVTFGSTDVENLLLPATNTLLSVDVQHHNLSNLPFSLALAPSLTDLNINYNDAFPLEVDISSNLELEDIDLAYNDMVSVDLSQNTKCTDLDVTGNELTALDLTQNIILENLRAGYNQLPSIDLTQNTFAERIILSHNLLTGLDITQNVELNTLYIDNNLFTTIGLDLTQNSLLRTLVSSHNQIESLDITQNPELVYLDISYNIFPGNSILEQFTDLIQSRDRLSGALIANNNLLSGPIPDFYSLYDPAVQTRRFRLHLRENRFHFGDIETQHLDLFDLTNTMSIDPSPDWVIDQYTYAPQEKVNAIESETRNAGESVTLTTTVRGTQNHYTWFKDGVQIPDAPDAPEYTITNLNTCHAGVYHSEITSDLVPFENGNPPGTDGKNLLLVRNDITLTVNATKDCVTLDMPLTDVPVNSGIIWNDNPGACGYKISIGTASGADDLLPETDVNEVTVYNHTSDFPANQDIFVTITPYYDDGDFPCTEQSFRTNNSTVAPECTFLSSPENNDPNVPSDLSRIEWNPANGADEYTITLTSPSGLNDITTSTTDTFLNVSNSFNTGEVVTVTIVPENSVSMASGCTSESFTIQSSVATPPSCTSLNNPADNATDVAVDLASISWDAVANATRYRITINGSSSNTNDETDLIVTGTSHSFANDFDNGETVAVTIVPLNGTVEPTTSCSTESFTIVSATVTPTPPSCTDLSTPLANATDVAVDTDITWDAATGATSYLISISSTSGNNDITDFDNGNSTTYNPPIDFANDDVVTVTITPMNGSVAPTSACAPESFTIVSATVTPTPPSCTDLSTPLANATDVAIDTGITWDAATDATSYLISISSTSGNNDITDFDNGNSTTYNPPMDFANDDTVTVTVTPMNGSVAPTSACAPESFTIVSATVMPTLPSCTTLAASLLNSTNVAVDTDISWEESDNANGYRLAIRTESNEIILEEEDLGLLTSFTLPEELPYGTTIFVSVTPYNGEGDAASCSEQSFTTEEEPIEPDTEDETKYGFSPDGDGINEYWHIDNIEENPENTVMIYNRWGDLIFQVEGYDNQVNVFNGQANQKTKMGAGELPSGTYFFNIQVNGDHNLGKLQGFVVLKR